MREIKFRVWDKITQCMYECESIHFNFFGEVEFVYLVLDALDDRWGGARSFIQNEVEVMQFTGLYDKTGKEIYESDVVEFTNKLEPWLKDVGVVEFSDGSFNIRGRWMRYFRWLDYEIRVVGNRFENPDLVPEGVLKEQDAGESSKAQG